VFFEAVVSAHLSALLRLCGHARTRFLAELENEMFNGINVVFVQTDKTDKTGQINLSTTGQHGHPPYRVSVCLLDRWGGRMNSPRWAVQKARPRPVVNLLADGAQFNRRRLEDDRCYRAGIPPLRF
jgi:hypothetical protein